jgi:hypothetical protein
MRPLSAFGFYRPPGFEPELLFVPGPTLPSLDGLCAADPLVMPFPLIPVVVPDFTLPDFILVLVPVEPGPTLPSLEAPGAGCICADAIVVAPINDAATKAESASLDRMKISF